MKKAKKVIFLLGALVLIMIICCWVISSHKSTQNKPAKVEKQQKKSPSKPTELPVESSSDKISSNEDVPPEREDINLQLNLEQKKAGKKLSPVEEKTIIESLQYQVSIDKNKTFFDYRYGFGMVPGIREIFKDTDEALCLITDKGKFFVKINPYSDLSRFEYEKESLLAINQAVPGFAPRPLCLGKLPKGGKFLIVNFLNGRWHDCLKVENQIQLAKKLAQLHQKKSPNGKFGFPVGKNNQWKDSWEKFFLENRWQPLWKRVCKKYPHDEELKKWGEVFGEKVIPALLGNLIIEPVLLHGNLDFDSFFISRDWEKELKKASIPAADLEKIIEYAKQTNKVEKCSHCQKYTFSIEKNKTVLAEKFFLVDGNKYCSECFRSNFAGKNKDFEPWRNEHLFLDLWKSWKNQFDSPTGQPVVFDPHSYYGHNEMDLALLGWRKWPNKISEPEFFAEYQKYHSLQAGFEERKALYQFYHWLHRKIICTPTSKDGWWREKLLIKMKKLGQKYN